MSETVILALISVGGTLGGTLVGSVLGYLGRWRSEKTAREREDRFRDHAERRRTYAEFLSVCERIYNNETGREVFVELKQSLFSVQMLAASKELVDAAKGMAELVVCLPANKDEAPSKVEVPSKEYGKRLDEFFETARRDLGLPALS